MLPGRIVDPMAVPLSEVTPDPEILECLRKMLNSLKAEEAEDEDELVPEASDRSASKRNVRPSVAERLQ
eukprot:5816453-Pyramimonas_sp.AAC.1